MARSAGWFRSLWSRLFVVGLLVSAGAACVDGATRESDSSQPEAIRARGPSAQARTKTTALRANKATALRTKQQVRAVGMVRTKAALRTRAQ